jgi:probable rRNA maturation factor
MSAGGRRIARLGVTRLPVSLPLSCLPLSCPPSYEPRLMNLDLDLQYAAAGDRDLPAPDMLRRWAEAALVVGRPDTARAAELSLYIVEEDEGARLNWEYRHKEGATNVLSFPVQAAAGAALPADILGDIVICAPVVGREAAEQGKSPEAHWAHLVVHGLLHLLGHDHETDQEARAMEGLETKILQGLDYPDPYAVPYSVMEETV